MKKILIIEDDGFIAKIYQTKLESLGYEVWRVANGKEGLAVLEQKLPDLILLDLVMPKMDGFTFLERLHENSEWKQIPVIISTNLSQKEDIERGMGLGATDYFVKTDTSMETFVDKVNKLLGK